MCSYGRLRPLPPLRAARGAGRPAGAARLSRSRSRPRPAGSRWWGRSPPRPRRSGSCAGCGWGRRCRAAPALRLVPPDPGGGALALERRARPARGDRGRGRVRPRRGGLLRVRRPPRAARGDLAGVLAAARRALGPGARLGAAPSRFAAHAAALQARPRRRPRARHVVEERDAARLPRAAAGRAAAHPARAPGAARGLRAARHPHARRGGRAALACGGRAVRPSRPARPRPGARARTSRSSRAGRRSRSRSGSTCPRPPRASSSSARWSCSWRACSPGASGAGARCGRSPCRLASWPAAPGASRSRCATRARTPSGSCSRSAPSSAELPAPAESLALEVEAFGPPAQDQGRLLDEAAARPARPPGRGRPPGAPGGRPRGGPEGARGGPRLAHPGAARGAGAVPGRARVVNRLGAPEPASVRADDRGVPRRGRARRRSTRCARNGWSRTAGGPGGRCGGATSSWSSTTAATWSSSAIWSMGGGSCSRA